MSKHKFRTAEDTKPMTVADPAPPPPAADPAFEKPATVWNEDMDAAPRDGSTIVVTESLDNEDGLLVRWYRALGTARPWKAPDEGWLRATSLPRFIDFQPVGWAPYVKPELLA